MRKTLCMLAVLLLGGMAWAADFTGTWKLNHDKSPNAHPNVTSMTMTLEKTGPKPGYLVYMDHCTTIVDELRTMRRLLTTKQVADLLGVHPQTVYKWSRIPGRIPCFRIGGAIRFDPAALAERVEAGSM